MLRRIVEDCGVNVYGKLELVKKFIIQFILLVIVILGATYFYKGGDLVTLPFVPQKPKSTVVTINQVKISVEVADTKEKRAQGLGGRQSLASDSGMLFIFEGVEKYPFWMKGLSFPLDFIWIKGEKIVDITENVPAPTPEQKDQDLTIYQSNEEIDKLIEVIGGFVGANNIKVGDTVIIQP